MSASTVQKALSKVFLINCIGSYKTSELIRYGKYTWNNNWITDWRFPLEKHAPMSRTIEIVEFDHDSDSEEVLKEFGRCGLERPTYEDALYFGIQHPEEQKKHPIVFLHEPVLNLDGNFGVLALSEDGGLWHLPLSYLVPKWIHISQASFVFASVRK